MNTTLELGRDLLSDTTALIAGGTGSVGAKAVEAFLDAGAMVVVPSRSNEKLERLRRNVPADVAQRLITLQGDMSDENDAVRIRRKAVELAGPLNAVVATLGRFVPAPQILDASLEDLQRVIHGYLTAHFVVGKTLIPALEETGGSFTSINGPLAFKPLFPGTGLVSTVTAAQAMLARTVMKERAAGSVRINELVIYTRFGWDEGGSDNGPVSQDDVARYLALLASESGRTVRGQQIHLNDPKSLGDLSGSS